MPYTWSQMTALVSAMMGDTANIAIDTGIIEAAILSSAREIAGETHRSEEIGTLATMAGSDTHVLDASPEGGSFAGTPYRVRKVLLQVANTHWRDLVPASSRIPTLHSYRDVPVTYEFLPGYNTLGDADVGPRLILYPIPNAVYTLKVVAWVLPSDSTAHPNGMALPTQAEDLILIRSVRRLGIAAGNRALDQMLQEEDEDERQVARFGSERAVRGSAWR